MDWQAERAMKRLFETGKPTVIIHDNASIHRAKLVQKRHQIWSKQGLSVFFLPPYSPEMNRIEEQWLYAKRLSEGVPQGDTAPHISFRNPLGHLKRQELCGYVFEDE